MKQVIYIDILFVINLFINYLILLLTVKITHIRSSRWRILGGAALGGIYSLLIFTPINHVIYTLIAKLLFSLSIIIVSFKNLTFKHLLQVLACFYSVNFAFAGAMFGILITAKPKGMVIRNGIVYFNISVITLIITSIVIFTILNLIEYLNKRRHKITTNYKLKIYLNENEITINAFVDTGNTLTDAFSNTPVIVAEYQAIKSLFPNNINLFFQGNEKILNLNIDNTWEKRIRLIPFSSMGGEGVLPAFRPDKIQIKNGNSTSEITKVFIAVCNNKLPIQEYSALLNSKIINEKVVLLT